MNQVELKNIPLAEIKIDPRLMEFKALVRRGAKYIELFEFCAKAGLIGPGKSFTLPVGPTISKPKPIREEPWKSRPGDCVYFIAAKSLKRVKIGFSSSVNGRLKSLSLSSPIPLTLLGSFPGTTRDEARVHNQWSHLRLHGEWFRLSDELETFIKNATTKNETGT